MKNEEIVRTVTVDCEQCLTEESIQVTVPSDPSLPVDWIEIHEGPPFNNSYQFCSPECFIAWHKRDKNERLTEYHTRMRARQQALNETPV